ncbi:uncharacterized protein LOC133493623 [Syngnathoides biaculeatus]|uniref:uncharacterized protein LOC133493623 n=1 Tax=Syngnathoides biaculeatus TaxID=300417 RepID=UPI002ADD3B28|nr:uncharacterized protein LOC133493623 [Syngnathoides biaculeatus]XP_061663175.1 uncharacterized protein LOC133493623 [Syngnathoides biaculeatus]XP_061663176.1 uncharacterized protein LOC133493623 [Syngnathoides biaculeatus]
MKLLMECKRLLKEYRRCFKCCSGTHVARECPAELKCNECESNQHCTVMHPDTAVSPAPSPLTESDVEQQNSSPPEVTSRCTKVCGEGRPPRSCAKICLVQVFPQGQRERSIKMYAILDDQSNRSLARSEFFKLFDIQGDHTPYLMRTCAGTTEMTGRKAVGFQIEALNGEVCLDLPPLIECNEVTSNRSEIPSPEIAHSHAHLRSMAPHIPKIDLKAQILILLGRDLIQVHKVRDQIKGPHNAPFAQRLDLGWVIVGEVYIDSTYKSTVSVLKTNVLQNGRPSFLMPCQNHISVRERVGYGGEHRQSTSAQLTTYPASGVTAKDKLGRDVFAKTEDDNKPALSFEDETFLEIMEAEFKRDEQNSWIAPLPFRTPRPRLPNNRAQALSRLHSLQRTLNKNPTNQNPADLATRSVPASRLTDTMWFTGPEFLHKPHQPETPRSFELVDPEEDVDVRPQPTTLATSLRESELTSEQFQRFSTWESLLRAVSFLIHQIRSHRTNSTVTCKGWHQCNQPRTPEELEAAKIVIIKAAQRDAYPEECVALLENRAIPKSSTILNLDPFVCDGLLRIGGRLRHASVNPEVKNPIILPKQSHVTRLLVSHRHAKVKHQGRQFTEGAIRSVGLWIVAGKRLIGSVLHRCGEL